ncbi:MAG: HAD-IA family hydrolase [Luteolibacter sp.]|uniref:HAD family hydrolase n=1 Tax=Luteolibacter sp. TaxID=1962973 RepID=UPI00326541F5
MKHGLIFDLDGTLVDSLEGIGASLNRALAAAGLPTHPLTAVRGFIGNGARVLVQRAAPAGSDDGLIHSLEQAFKEDYDVTWPDGTILYDGISTLLESLQNQGYPLAVLSNKPHPFTVAMVSQLFPGIHFTAVLGQRPGIHHKPDPAGALEISAEFGFAASDCTVIGDSTLDIETAHNAGMKSIAVMWGFHDRERLLDAKPGRTVENPGELLEVFSVNP